MRPGLSITLYTMVRLGCVTGALAAAADATLSFEAAPLSGIHAAGVGAAFGALSGLFFGALLWVLAGRSLRVCLALCLPLGLLGGVGWAYRLNAFREIVGAHPLLGAATLGACSAAGLAMGLLIAASPPVHGEGHPFGRPRRVWLRVALVLGLLLAFAVVSLVDRWVPYMPAYPAAQAGLRLLGLWALFFGAALVTPVRVPGLYGGVEAAVLGAVTGVAFGMLPVDAEVAVYPLTARPYAALPLEALRGALDVDGDGYAGTLGGGDCAPFDAAVHPGAREVPDNGVDEDCVGGDRLPRIVVPDEDVPVPTAPSPMSVVLITIDSLHPDHTSAYGYRRDTTPKLAAWARGAVRFDNAYAAAPWTSLSISAALRGIYPRRIRWTMVYETSDFALVRDPRERPPGTAIRSGFALPIDDPHPTLASWLSRRGMATEAVVDDGRTDFLSPDLGAYEGFDAVHETDDLPEARRSDRGTADLALARLTTLAAGDRPFFLWVHFFGPHSPDEMHDGVTWFGDSVADRYDHEILYCDRHVGRLLDAIERHAAREPIVTIVASDHGEVLGPLGRAHGVDLSRESLRVPLLVRGPGFRPRVVSRMASLVDLPPTILALTGTPGPSWFDGVDLRVVADGGVPDRVLLAELLRFDPEGRRTTDQITAFDSTHRVTRDLLTRTRNATMLDGTPPRNRFQALQGTVGRELARYLRETGEQIVLTDDPVGPPARRREGRREGLAPAPTPPP